MRGRNVKRLARRAAFTLIELLVVIAIIAVLMGLLMSGVMAVLHAKNRTANAYDIDKLEQGMAAAINKYPGSSKTLPGKLVLCNNIDVYNNPGSYAAILATVPATTQDLARSKDALRRMFGTRLFQNADPTRVVNWDGSGNLNSVSVLEGHQCLVFYVGGLPDRSQALVSMTGFSTDPVNPATAGGADRIGPFYTTFEMSRMIYVGSSKFPSYLDRYGTPFAYFGGTGGANTYVSYCPSLPCPNNPTVGPSAYQESATPPRFTKPDTWQIISAGRDKQFGAGGLWVPAQGTKDTFGRDDQSNFGTYQLGAPQ